MGLGLILGLVLFWLGFVWIRLDFGLISSGFWLGLGWIWLGVGLDFALSVTFTRIVAYSSLSQALIAP